MTANVWTRTGNKDEEKAWRSSVLFSKLSFDLALLSDILPKMPDFCSLYWNALNKLKHWFTPTWETLVNVVLLFHINRCVLKLLFCIEPLPNLSTGIHIPDKTCNFLVFKITKVTTNLLSSSVWWLTCAHTHTIVTGTILRATWRKPKWLFFTSP